MVKPIIKYNPAFLSDEELIESFVVRQVDLELIMQTIQENLTESNQHIMVTGPRGIGKTMLVLRVAAEVRRDKDLCSRWYPLVFAEESYQVSTPGEFWLEALFHLGQQTDDERWRRSYRELNEEQDENRLRERALAELMDFADSEGNRILLIVENFNMLLGSQISDDDAWKLRHTLLNEPRIMLLASATRRFNEMDSSDKPMFELFKPHELKPLNEAECQMIWASETGKDPGEKRIRPIQILTGGNPRLLTIIASFAVRLSFKELMQDLIQLVDEHTEYFKSHLDQLPAVERKVYVALAELWDPVTASEAAKLARLNVSKTSALLRRLIERGAVVVSKERGRKKWYQIAERMYNIYYLMRRRGVPSRRVRAVVRFMVLFYGEEELIRVTRRIAEEACELEAELRRDHYRAFEEILQTASDESIQNELVREIPKSFFEMEDTPKSIRSLIEREKPTTTTKEEEEWSALLKEADELREKPDRFEEAEGIYRKAIEIAPNKALSWLRLGKFLMEKLERYDEAENAYRKAIELDEKYAPAWSNLGWIFHYKLERYDEAEAAYRKALEIDGKYTLARASLGMLLQDKLERYDEAEKLFHKAIEINEKDWLAWMNLGWLLHEKLERYDEAENAYRKAIELQPEVAWGYAKLGELLNKKLERYDEAENAYRKAIELQPEVAWGYAKLGEFLQDKLERYDEAENAYRKAIELDEKFALAWTFLGGLFHDKLERYDEAENAYRKAIELEEKDASAWALFGLLLHEKLERYDEAENAYRKAIELDEKYAPVWGNLGLLFHEKLERYDEAEKAYRKAIELQPEVAWGYVKLGELFQDKLERYEEAEKVYRKAIELDPDLDLVWGRLIELLLINLKRPTEAFNLAKGCIERTPENAILLNNFAWNFYEYGQGCYLGKTEEWARRAVETKPDNGYYQHTLATILATLGKKKEALELTQKYLSDSKAVQATIDDAISLFVELAAHDYAKEALGILKDSESAKILEPLVVGLQLFVGEDVNTAVEIMEIGKDVVKRIQKRREKENKGK